jgi:hypothetical protein
LAADEQHFHACRTAELDDSVVGELEGDLLRVQHAARRRGVLGGAQEGCQ